MYDTVELTDLKSELDPSTRGYEAGQQGLPPLDAVRDPHEQPITNVIERHARRAAGSLAEWQHEARRDFAKTGGGGGEFDPSGDFSAELGRAEGQFESLVKTRRPELDHKRLEREKLRRDFANFREDHGLTRREPHYPDTGTKWLMLGVLVFMFAFESFANSAFLAKGNELGIVGAYTITMGISSLNIVPAFLFIGPLSRYMGHVDRWRSALAGVGIAIYLLFALVLNLGVAHYREVSASLIGEAGPAVVQRMQESSFGLQDAESWLLFGLGFLFCTIAVLEGRAFDDVYPDYGKRHRKMIEARKQYDDELKGVHYDLEGIRENSLDLVRRIVHNARERPDKLRRIAETWHQQIIQFDEHVASLQDVGRALIDEYRQANRAARPDGAVPEAHQTQWRLPIPTIDRSDLMTSSDDDPTGSKWMRRIEEQGQLATNQINALCKGARDSLTPGTPSAPADAGAHGDTRNARRVVGNAAASSPSDAGADSTVVVMNPGSDTRAAATSNK